MTNINSLTKQMRMSRFKFDMQVFFYCKHFMLVESELLSVVTDSISEMLSSECNYMHEQQFSNQRIM